MEGDDGGKFCLSFLAAVEKSRPDGRMLLLISICIVCYWMARWLVASCENQTAMAIKGCAGRLPN